MSVVVMDSDDLERLLEKVVSKAIEAYAVQVPTSLPPVLSIKQFMALLDISRPTATEVMRRPDFPVNREFGNPRIPTGLLLQWIDKHTEWIDQNAGEDFKARRRRAFG
ncbi:MULTISPECIES: DNA-binding protein [unclassified Paenibacillus]|uniref:DNA-binding protein n=1 Tax=unclassified Paenibacillus TaxID=185978 RepID=UPI0030F76594